MSIKVDRTKKEFNINDSALASEDLSNYQFCCVDATGSATGNMTVGLPTAGEKVYGVLENAPDSGEIAQIVVEGICEIRANSTFNAGVELTSDGAGRVGEASSSEFVVGIAREASQSVGHAVSVLLKQYYKA
jgi:hypothetical protein